jgi:FG-GAP-like repeat/Secretion system C-terminal sorting domain
MNTAKYIWLLLFLLSANGLAAQTYSISNDIPVFVGGHSLKSAWAGGLTAPQLSAIDLDNDGLLDLVIYERDGGALLPLLRGATTGQIDFAYAPQFLPQFPVALSDWVLLRDFDADGLIDIFAAIQQVSQVRVFRNTSGGTGSALSFSLYQDTVISSYPPVLPLYSSKSDLPAIDDVDGDGDLDFITFQLSGTKVEWHKNLSVESTGGLGSLVFKRQSRCFGHFEEDAFDCTALIGRVPCGTGERDAAEEFEDAKIALHSGSTILSLDLDNNGLKDLVIGDVGCATLYGLYNGGTPQIANFDSLETDYPASDSAANVLLFPASYFVDVDNDGIKDLLVAPNKDDQVEDRRSIQYFKNLGSNLVPDFKFQRFGILQDEMIDMGTAAMPTFFDYDGDGLQDLLVGGAGRFDSLIGYVPLLQLYQNTGTAQLPAFTLVSADFMSLSQNAAFANVDHLRPACGDLDGDGDTDLLLGCTDGAIFHFTNTAGPGNPATFNLQTPNFAGIDIGLSSAPQLIDIDVDGDLDLLVGDHRGFVHYYGNVGSAQVPSFALVTDSLGHVKVNDFTGLVTSNGYAQPFACDYDGDSDLDLMVGGVGGEVQVYENISLVPNAAFTRVGDFVGRDFGTDASIAAAILDSARLSFVVGSHRGGLSLLRDSGPVGVAHHTPDVPPTIKLYPNPASDQVSFEIVGAHVGLQGYGLYDALGRMQAKGTITGNAGEIDLGHLPDGIYIAVFTGKSGAWSQRVVVAH